MEIRCGWKKCGVLLGFGNGPAYAWGNDWLCEKHMAKADREWKRTLDRADLALSQEKERARYAQVEFGSHKEARRPMLVCG